MCRSLYPLDHLLHGALDGDNPVPLRAALVELLLHAYLEGHSDAASLLLAPSASGSRPRSAAATHGSFDAFLWDFVGGQPRLHTRRADEPCPSKDATSEAMSAALKARGFRFVGPTICYSLMQSCGLIVDHPAGTPEWETAKRRLEARPR